MLSSNDTKTEANSENEAAAPPSTEEQSPETTNRPRPEAAATCAESAVAGPPESAEAQPVVPVKPPVSALAGAIIALQEAQKSSHDRLLRVAADFENYKTRSRRDLGESVRRAEERVVLEFLPVMDNLERALDHAGTEAGPLRDGVAMIHKQFLAVLEKHEIKPFVSVGEPFDPERHEAIQQAPSEFGLGIVCHEAQRGYLRGDRLVRPAMVVVSLGPATAPAPKPEVGEAPEAAPEITEQDGNVDQAHKPATGET